MAYVKETFDPISLAAAKNIVLTDDPNNPDKFESETKLLVDTFQSFGVFTHLSKVVDYGCGMGRVSKELSRRYNCHILGIDQSSTMLQYAKEYVNTPAFKTYEYYSVANTIDVCFSVLVLQHAEFPEQEINNIYNIVKPNGYFILCNEPFRLVPSELTSDGYVIWNDDQIDIEKLVSSKFKEITRSYDAGNLPVILYQKQEV